MSSSAVFLTLFFALAIVRAEPNPLEGAWVNEPDVRGITKLDIARSSNGYRVHIFGLCEPADCDWGVVTGHSYAPGVAAQFRDTVDSLVVEYVQTFARRLVTIAVEKDRLRVDVFTTFTDSSGRLPYHTTEMLRRAVDQRRATQMDLGPPVLLAPLHGSVFDEFPRVLNLRWEDVPGAARYAVEIDCFHCCERNRWCSDLGRKTFLKEVDSPAYTHSFVGAQPGRWRVWTIGPDGGSGPKSDWWEFRYTR